MILRPYQQDFVSGVAHGFNNGFMRQLGVLPTGGGKTIVFAKIAQRFWEKRGERTLVLAHREELISQAADKIQTATGLVPSIEKASQRGEMDSPVVVASIQTMQGDRLQRWASDHFGLVVADEAHHVLADQWRRTLDHFSPARVLGVTATPDRSDKKRLADFFDNLAYECNILDLIRQKYLSPIRISSVPIQIDMSDVRSVAGDFDANALDAAIRPYLGNIARHIAANCQDRKRIVAFLPLIETSQRFVECCLEAGIAAVHVDGASKDRREILSDFHSGKFQLLSNAMLLTEGWDEPSVDCILVLRPTRSRSLYSQMCGRGTRLYPGKDHLLLLDFLWLHERHSLVKPASLVAKDKDEEERITKALKKDGDLSEAEESAAADREAALIRELAEKAKRESRFVDLEHIGALLKDSKIQEYSPVFGWEKMPASDKQKALLAKFGVQANTKGEASLAVSRLFDRSKQGLATVKQLIWLHRMKHPSPETATRAEAKAFLDAKWAKKVPHGAER